MILQIVDEDDNVLWDLASFPSTNAEGIITTVSPSIDLAMPATEYNYFHHSGRPGGVSTKTRDPLTPSNFIPC